MTRLLVCGGRNFTNRQLLDSVLDNFLWGSGSIDVVIEGEARGADTLAREWAESRGIPIEPYPAKWGLYGKRAGPIRNQQMLDEGKPTYGIAFFDRPQNESRGTADMVWRLENAGINVIILIKAIYRQLCTLI